jgi:hypothetical protein
LAFGIDDIHRLGQRGACLGESWEVFDGDIHRAMLAPRGALVRSPHQVSGSG